MAGRSYRNGRLPLWPPGEEKTVAYTWAEIAGYVNEVAGKEGAKPNASFLRLLANQALRVISRRALVYEKVWTNGAGGALTLSGAAAALPEDCYAVNRVEWDGSDNELPYRSIPWLDRNESGWRTATGEPSYHTRTGRYLLLDSIPATAVGKLVVRGRGPLPDFSEEAEAENPLAWLPTDHQLLPAYYVLKELPVDPGKPAATQRRAEAETRWAEGLAALVAAVATREDQAFRF